jgi:hypothetical protein
MGEIRNSCVEFIGKGERKRLPARYVYRYEVNVKDGVKDTDCQELAQKVNSILLGLF